MESLLLKSLYLTLYTKIISHVPVENHDVFECIFELTKHRIVIVLVLELTKKIKLLWFLEANTITQQIYFGKTVNHYL